MRQNEIIYSATTTTVLVPATGVIVIQHAILKWLTIQTEMNNAAGSQNAPMMAKIEIDLLDVPTICSMMQFEMLNVIILHVAGITNNAENVTRDVGGPIQPIWCVMRHAM